MLETMKRILTMAGKYRHKVTIGIIISLLHSFFSAMDLFAILYISFSINTLTQQKIGVAAAILLVGLTGKIICKYQITEHISGSSYDVFYEKRLEAGEKLKRVPMGYFSEKNLGEIQMAMTTRRTTSHQRCDEIEKCTWCFSKIGVYLCTAHVISLDNSR